MEIHTHIRCVREKIDESDGVIGQSAYLTLANYTRSVTSETTGICDTCAAQQLCLCSRTVHICEQTGTQTLTEIIWSTDTDGS